MRKNLLVPQSSKQTTYAHLSAAYTSALSQTTQSSFDFDPQPCKRQVCVFVGNNLKRVFVKWSRVRRFVQQPGLSSALLGGLQVLKFELQAAGKLDALKQWQ